MTSTVSDPRLEGYRKWEGFDPFEEQTGPFYFREEGEGQFRCAFISGDQQMNCTGAMHGGALMTFADFAMFVFARPCLTDTSAVTVSFSADFTAAAGPGEFLESTGEVVRETGSLIFVRGTIFRSQSTLMSFSGVLKKVRLRGDTGSC